MSQLFDDVLKVGKAGLEDLLLRCRKDAEVRKVEGGVTLKNHIGNDKRPPSIKELITRDLGDGLSAFSNIGDWITNFRAQHAASVASAVDGILHHIDEHITRLTGVRKTCQEDVDAGEKMEVESIIY